MSWRTALFGPSRADAAESANAALLAMLREDRAAYSVVLAKFLDNAEAQTALARAQFDLMTAPTGPTEVRLMTPAIEAQYERDRLAPHTTPAPLTTLDPSQLLSDLARDFAVPI